MGKKRGKDSTPTSELDAYQEVEATIRESVARLRSDLADIEDEINKTRDPREKFRLRTHRNTLLRELGPLSREVRQHDKHSHEVAANLTPDQHFEVLLWRVKQLQPDRLEQVRSLIDELLEETKSIL